MARVDAIRVAQVLLSPEGQLRLAEGGVRVAIATLDLSARTYMGGSLKPLWRELHDMRQALRHLEEKVQEFKTETGHEVSPKTLELISYAKSAIEKYKQEIPRLPARIRELMAM